MAEIKKHKKILKENKTLALAERKRTDRRSKASRPSEENVESTREWSIEKKL